MASLRYAPTTFFVLALNCLEVGVPHEDIQLKILRLLCKDGLDLLLLLLSKGSLHLVFFFHVFVVIDMLQLFDRRSLLVVGDSGLVPIRVNHAN